MKILRVVLLVLALFSAGSAQADEAADAVRLVDQAIAYANESGIVMAFEQINRQNGLFSTPNGLYVFVYYLDGTMAAHYNQSLVGVNLLDKPDAQGKLFRKEIIEMAKSKGEGWVDYMYQEKATGKVTSKSTYLKKFDGFVFCCGITK